ncbi:sugar ABC transporter substrate-binding protein [Chryseomicrobium excrementi]|uniref:Sugar ABC transporter substrate-binding protein n=1 Tax=Chryseomicrobium excrementi TaxID=2041346 RepID=A0A2M9EYH2_9BACL|nr:substrate-binding domain-containing protein [Chryseomicrobium excrementi]PJK16267.1 sugar ABC transporter substrate-binding protein [Chryseomicrobium excrementi]
MKRTVTRVLSVCIVFFAIFTVISVWRVIQATPHFPEPVADSVDQLRIVLITENQSTDFWKQVEEGAIQAGEKQGVLVEAWAGFGTEDQDFNRNLETAIYSKVDGILVQGQDTEAFKELTKIKAAFYGVPIITVGEDVPAEESLRKTYVGSNQIEAASLLAETMAEKMNYQGEIVVVGDEQPTYMQKQRLQGVEQTLEAYPEITFTYQGMGDTKEEIMNATMERLNQSPDATSWLVLDSKVAYFVTQEIKRRTQVDPYLIYSFDEAPEVRSLLQAGVIDGMIRQRPQEMGEQGLNLLVQWIRGETVPLNSDGYPTPFVLEEAGL